MAETRKQQTAQRRARAADGAEEDLAAASPAEDTGPDAATTDAATTTTDAASDPDAGAESGSTEGGSTLPPEPPAPTAEAATYDSEAIPQSVMLARAERLLGVSAELARGPLAEAEDPLTVGAAKERIQTFLDNPVQQTEEA